MPKPIVLPIDIIETLHFAALAFGGVGEGRFTDGGVPHCIHGLACAAGIHKMARGRFGSAVGFVPVLERAGLTTTYSDRSLMRVRSRKVKWETYVRLVNLQPKETK